MCWILTIHHATITFSAVNRFSKLVSGLNVWKKVQVYNNSYMYYTFLDIRSCKGIFFKILTHWSNISCEEEEEGVRELHEIDAWRSLRLTLLMSQFVHSLQTRVTLEWTLGIIVIYLVMDQRVLFLKFFSWFRSLNSIFGSAEQNFFASFLIIFSKKMECFKDTEEVSIEAYFEKSSKVSWQKLGKKWRKASLN